MSRRDRLHAVGSRAVSHTTPAPARSLGVTVETKALLEALAALKPAVARRSVVEVLSGVLLLTGSKGNVMLAASDMEVSAVTSIAATVNGKLDVVVPHAGLVANLRHMGSTVTLSIADGELAIASGGRTARLQSLRRDDFPKLDVRPSDHLFDIDAAAYVAAVAGVQLAAGRDDTRPVLTGVALEDHRLIATDSYRMHVYEHGVAWMSKPDPAKWAPAAHEHTGPNVPARLCGAVAKRAAKIGGRVAISWRDRSVVMILDNGERWVSRTIDGQYPNWRMLWPEEDTQEMTLIVNRRQLLDAAEYVAQAVHRNVPAILSLEWDRLVLSTQTPDVGSAEESVKYRLGARRRVEGEWRTGVNSVFLVEALKSAATDEVQLWLRRPLQPFCLIAGPLNVMLMPIRINS